MHARPSNLGPGGVRVRFLSGVATLLVALGVGLALHFTGVDRWWRLALLLPLWSGALGLLQARERT
jgi:hypothetical protein